jgi:hypothetical protein
MPEPLRIERFASMSSGVTLELAPGAKTMLLSPFPETTITATPDAPSLVETPVVSTPAFSR